MTNRLPLTNDWQLVGTGDSAMVQSSAVAILYIGEAAPAENAPGFNAKWGIPVDYQLAQYGGSMWAKGKGVLTYVISV